MKKNLLFVLPLLVFIEAMNANPVPVAVAQTVASNFYAQTTHKQAGMVTLAYAEKSEAYGILYYVFNVNSGFIIISGDDAVSPVLGYSTEGNYTTPQPGNNVYYWMQKEASNISYVKSNNIQASAQTEEEWAAYQNNSKLTKHRLHSAKAIAPLCKTTWDQPYPYNIMCPGGSVTGCVATCMAQILKYWNYPAHGIGSSFYYEYSPENYGLLTANYDTSDYVWSSMPNLVSGDNQEVAKLMYDCGVSVDMSYSPSESGAWVITADDKICAQTSFVNYFGYNAATIQGIQRKNYSDSAWIAIIDTELNNNRVMEYAGWDTVYGGHTWVCDGYDSNNRLHMNWGWSGADNGYYALDTLNPGPYFWIRKEELVIGIEPPSLVASFDASPLVACAGSTIAFTDKSLISDPSFPITNWQWSFPGGTPATANTKDAWATYTTAGTYPVTLIVTNSNSTDTLTKTSYITVNGPNPLPFIQNFEGPFPPAQWTLNNPWLHAGKWAQYSGTGGYGNSTHCIYYNNRLNGVKGNNDQVFTPVYDFSLVSNPYIYFDVAYTPYDITYSDTLAVYYSLDCGATFTRVYLKGGMNLCTTGGVTLLQGANSDMNGCFVPLSNNWRTDTIMIPAIANKSNVMFSFENRSGNGSSIYLDNINVPVSTGIDNITENTSLNVYPNPNNGNFTITFNRVSGIDYDLSVYNVLGQQIISKKIQGGQGLFFYPIDLSGYAKGVYSVVLKDGSRQSMEKVSIF